MGGRRIGRGTAAVLHFCAASRLDGSETRPYTVSFGGGALLAEGVQDHGAAYGKAHHRAQR